MDHYLKKGILGLSLNASLDLDDNKEDKFHIISQYNKKVETDSLSMITGNIPEKSTYEKLIHCFIQDITNEFIAETTSRSSFSSSRT